MNLTEAISTGISKCPEQAVPESLTQLVETLNTELGHLGVFKASVPFHYSGGAIYLVTLKQEGSILVDSFAQLTRNLSGDYTFCEVRVDLSYQSLYDAMVGWLKVPANILQLNLNKQHFGEAS